MSAVRRIDGAERRARLGRRHLLAPGEQAAGVAAVARHLVGLHGTDPTSYHLAAFARADAADVSDMERALYDDRSMLRVLCMRRTVFVEPIDLVPVVAAACSRDVAAKERQKLVGFARAAEVDRDVPRWLAGVESVLMEALASMDQPTASELAAADERLRVRLTLAPGTKYETTQTITSRLLTVLAAEGKVVRARPQGSWTSNRARWATARQWCPELPAPWDPDEAAVELARRWLTAFGPATVDDLRWWTGWTAARTKTALAGVGPVEVSMDGTTGLVVPGDEEPVSPTAPWVALLPALDPTTMGWKHRAFYLGDYGPQLFDVNGNASPTVWVDGRVVGGWAQRPDGEVVMRLLEEVGADAKAALSDAGNRLESRIGDERVAPRARGRSPVEKALVSPE